jgi:hypothetical protein
MESYKKGGLRKKYYIQKIKQGKGESFFNERNPDWLEPVEPNADYFVLRLDKDPHAQNALLAYAESVRIDNPQLANDLEDKLMNDYGWEIPKFEE